MTAIDTLNVVTAAVSQALEKMAFLMILPFEEEPEIPQSVITSEIDFSGPVNGKLQIAAGKEFAELLAENISGLQDLHEDEQADAMKELVNVTCGLVLPMISTSRADVFDLTVPHLTTDKDHVHWKDFTENDGAAILNIEGYPLAVKLIIH